MRKNEVQKSRRTTPWDDEDVLTPTQAFLKGKYDMRYNNHHLKVSESGEVEMVNSYSPAKCPFCHFEQFKKSGFTNSGVWRYKCACGKTFLPTTGTIFDEHKLSGYKSSF